ncbi:hypothetical protein [Paraburkholderia youngii]|uniref:hypothetical protein n=1 Tax=Paraburkholderia youngii TaxID=2782701 RepID=UPI003D249A62
MPSRAIINTQDGTQLYVVAADGRVQLRPVTTGASVEGMTEVRSGVAPADLVVFDGQSRLNPGMRVAANMVAATAEAPGHTATPAGDAS